MSDVKEPVLRDEKRLKKWYMANSGQKPIDVNGQVATRTEFYRSQLRLIVKSIFEVTCPISWDIDYQLDLLINRGFYVISKTPTAGILPVRASLTGLNYISMPTKAVMSTPILGNWENEIGKTCEVIYLERYAKNIFYRLANIIDIFAQRLASADSGIDTNLFNCKMAYIAEAENKAQADTIKSLYDKVSNGEPLVVYRQGSLDPEGLKLFFGNVKNTYIANEIQDTKRSIMNEFLTAIGINNANTDKKERLITSEVDSNNIELQANTAHWKYTLKRQVKRVKNIFPELEFDIKLRFDAEEVQRLNAKEESLIETDTKK